MTTPIRIVLTGGPSGGKTTLMHEIRVEDPHAERWLMVPEAAPLLFQSGLTAQEKCFQKAVVRLQIALEDTLAEAARPGHILICHRGTLDALAYWLCHGWDEDEFFSFVGIPREAHYERYVGVLHLQTAAVDAQAHYRRWPDAHRPESIEQAAEIDRFCARAWNAHPNYLLIENYNHDWFRKSCIAQDELARWITRQ